MMLTATKEKMEAELKALTLQPQMERSSDGQKEQNVAADDDVQLSALLEDKVPDSNGSCCCCQVFVYDISWDL